MSLPRGRSPCRWVIRQEPQTLFHQAAQMLETTVAGLGKPSERDLGRFLAATHYY